MVLRNWACPKIEYMYKYISVYKYSNCLPVSNLLFWFERRIWFHLIKIVYICILSIFKWARN